VLASQSDLIDGGVLDQRFFFFFVFLSAILELTAYHALAFGSSH
jgi:hypothetical protein